MLWWFGKGAASDKLPWVIFSCLSAGDCPQGPCNDRAEAIFCKMAQSGCTGWLLPCAWVPPANWCPGISVWHTSWFLSGSCYLATSGEEVATALGSCPWETFVLQGGQICTGEMPGKKCQHDLPSPSPARVDCRPGRADSPSNGHTLNHTHVLSKENTACSGNLSSCLTSLDSSTYIKHLTRWNRHCLMQLLHSHCSVQSKMKGKCVWPKPGMSPQPPASASCTIVCCPAVRSVCTWSAPGPRRYVIKEDNSLGIHFVLWGGSPWASPCLQCVRCALLHREQGF